jgi:hypothetical protein
MYKELYASLTAAHLYFREIFIFYYCLFSPTLNGLREADRDYYNDLPGKVPPDIGPPPVPPLPVCSATLPNLKHHHSNSSSSGVTTSNIQNTPLPDPVPKSGRQAQQQWPGNFYLSAMIGNAIAS